MMRRQEYWWRLFSEITLNMSIRAFLRSAGPLLVTLLAPGVSLAQDTPLSSILPDLLGNTITLLPSNLPDQPNHVAHFRPGFDQLQVPTQVNQALVTLLSTYPLGSPSGGFTYTFDPALGTLTRSSDSFGPSFAERALTTGRGKVERGLRSTSTPTYDTFEGLNLRQGGDDVLRAAHRLLQPRHRESVVAGWLTSHASVRRRSDRGQRSHSSSSATPRSLFLSYGMLDRLDVSRGHPVRPRRAQCQRARQDRAAGDRAGTRRPRL